MNLLKINNKSAELVSISDKNKSEQSLEELVEKNPHIIFGHGLLIIGRQVKTDTGKILDLLAVDKEGRLVVIELKRGYAPREIIAQILDYSSWLSNIPERRIEDIAKNYFQRIDSENNSLFEAFIKFYGVVDCPEIGGEVINILFAKEFSEEVINPAKYLYSYDLSIYCIRFEFFESKVGEYMVTDNVVGDFDEYYSESNDVRNDKNENRSVVKQLVDYLQENYSKDCSDVRFEKLFDFKLYQSRDGQWTCAYIDWVYDDGTRFAIEFGIQSSTEEGLNLYSYFQSRTKSDVFVKKTHSEEAKELLKEYDDESENGKTYFGKYKKVQSIKFDVLKTFADEEIPKLLKFIQWL